ncbi:hypothetical protein [Rhodococcus sp. UNC363MFTsu5.1]|uniref:hypothetical protein n=1 Tax=Rhodococcus sp. UNC363MFTsu5.1 TaxID=1449069 RepID=UPI000A6AF77A|nr:hypothetical protein [Rhodococcus sp. UNC363MFTsu5.1]
MSAIVDCGEYVDTRPQQSCEHLDLQAGYRDSFGHFMWCTDCDAMFDETGEELL